MRQNRAIAAPPDIDSRCAVLIGGMHRSGTSMVTKLLHRLGLHLGPADQLLPAMPANQDGYWEHRPLMLFNARLLSRLGGGWDHPPVDAGAWEGWDDLDDLDAEARDLLRRLDRGGPWGWKDPRTSLLLPFWRRLLPHARVVLCLRNPLEVAGSLHVRNDMSPAQAYALWVEYGARALAGVDAQRRIVTHYDAYFHAPEAEVRRVAAFLGLGDGIPLAAAPEATLADLRHHRRSVEELAGAVPRAVLELYARLCREAGWIDRAENPGRPEGWEPHLDPVLGIDAPPSAWAVARRVAGP